MLYILRNLYNYTVFFVCYFWANFFLNEAKQEKLAKNLILNSKLSVQHPFAVRNKRRSNTVLTYLNCSVIIDLAYKTNKNLATQMIFRC